MKNLAGCAVHQRRSTNDRTPKYFANGLMAKADTENRNRFIKMTYNVFGDSGIRRRAGARRNNNTSRFQAVDFVQSDLIIPEYARFLAEFAQVLHQVISERIVIIDNENHIFPGARSIFQTRLAQD